MIIKAALRECKGIGSAFRIAKKSTQLNFTRSSSTDLERHFRTEGIVPYLIREAPSTEVTIVYPIGTVRTGEVLHPQCVKYEPGLQWSSDPSRYYTLLVVDPDAPWTRFPVLASVNHFLVGNIKGNRMTTGDYIVDYRGASPPKYSGYHRYTFLIFDQGKRSIDFDEPRLGTSKTWQRMMFSVEKFMDKYGFDRVHAGNFFKAKWQPSRV